MTELLITVGVDTTAMSNDRGETPLEMARRRGHWRAVALLEAHE